MMTHLHKKPYEFTRLVMLLGNKDNNVIFPAGKWRLVAKRFALLLKAIGNKKYQIQRLGNMFSAQLKAQVSRKNTLKRTNPPINEVQPSVWIPLYPRNSVKMT